MPYLKLNLFVILGDLGKLLDNRKNNGEKFSEKIVNKLLNFIL